jgi:small subunit ribosomal protein S27e
VNDMVGNFVKIKCLKCNNEQNVFSKPVTVVKCLVCGEVIAEPNGGKILFKDAEIVEEMKY